MLTWTPERDAALRQMHANYSFREIAAELGVTRSAAIGRAGRLGLAKPRGTSLSEAEKKAREGARARSTTRANAGSAPARPSARIGEGPWDEVIQRIHRQYQQVPKRQFPQAKARYLREALSWIAATDEELRYQDGFDEDSHERALARALERLASVLDLPAVLVALQFENMKRAGEL